MAVVADLHIHTTNSDGSLDLPAIPKIARRAGLQAVAITDHDRLHPGLTDPITHRGGVDVIHGIELKVHADERIDLLGYAVDPTPALRTELDRIQRDRIERGAAIIDRVEAHLEVDLNLTAREGLGRPHIARAIADHPGTDYDYQGAFDHLIGDGRPCHVPRDIPSFARGHDLLAGSSAVVALAHPLRYDDPAAAIARASDLDAIERWYPYDRTVDLTPVDNALDTHDLLATGGSDAHDDRLGLTGLDEATYRRVREHLPTPE